MFDSGKRNVLLLSMCILSCNKPLTLSKPYELSFVFVLIKFKRSTIKYLKYKLGIDTL